MIKTIIVDSDAGSMARIRELMESSCPQVKILCTCKDAAVAKEKIAFLEPDLVILDVVLPDKSGFVLLDELGRISFETIFVTGCTRDSLQAFRYGAVDYLTKPVDETLLVNAIKRAARRIAGKNLNKQFSSALRELSKKQQQHEEMKLCIPSLKGFQVINLSDIIYCEAESSYTKFHLSNGKQVLASRPIIEYEQMLQHSSFCRIHKSFMVNMTHIKEYQRGEGGTVILTNSREVEVSRRKRDVFMNKMKVLFKY